MNGEFRDEKGELCVPCSRKETLVLIATFLAGLLGLTALCATAGMWMAGSL